MYNFTIRNLLRTLIFGLTFYADGDGTGGGSGTPDPAKAAADAEKAFNDKVAEAVATANAGVNAKNQELLGKLRVASDQLKAFEGFDPVKTKEMLKRLENDEEGKLISEGKIDEVVVRRTERMRTSMQTEADTKVKEALTKAEMAEQRAMKFSQRVLDNHIRAAAAKAGLHPHAIEDALFRGRNMFALDENGDAVQLGSDGKPVLGKDGKNPFNPMEWLEGMKSTAPHWFPVGNSGGGSNGDNRNVQHNGKTITRADFDTRTPADKAAVIKSGVKVVD